MKKLILILSIGLLILAGCTEKNSTNPNETDPITITSPANNSSVQGIVSIRTAIGADYDINRVTFYIDGDSVYIDFSSPFTYEWDVGIYESGSQHTIRARAYDDSTSYLSSVITVTITAPGDNQFVFASNFDLGVPVLRLRAAGNNVYAALGTNGMQVINYDSPSSPNAIFLYSGTGNIVGIDAHSPYLVTAELDNGIRLFNISNPDTVLVKNQLVTSGRAWNVKISGNIVYVADNDGAQIASISGDNLNSITRISISSGLVEDIDEYNSVLYILDINGVTAYDVSQPNNPTYIGRFDGFTGQCQSVSAYGNYVFVGTTSEIQMLSHDVDSSLAIFSSQLGFTGVYAISSVVFACQGGSGGQAYAFDYSGGDSLAVLDSYTIDELSHDITYQNNYVYVATQTKLVAFRFEFVPTF